MNWNGSIIYVSFHASKQVIGTLVIQPKISIIFEKLNKDGILFIHWGEKGCDSIEFHLPTPK